MRALLLVLLLAAAAWAQAGGVLRAVGAVPGTMVGQVVTPLPDGAWMAYGYSPLGFARHSGSRELVQTLANRHETTRGGTISVVEPVLWSPKLRAWRKIEPPPNCSAGMRFLHQATTLADGRVLFSGGLCDPRARMMGDPPMPEFTGLAIWNPAAGRWDAAPSMATSRLYHSATLLADGGVMIAGGQRDPAITGHDQALATANILRDGALLSIPSMGAARAAHAAALVAGKLWVSGGQGSDGRAQATVESWQDGSWQDLPPMNVPRYQHAMTVLPDGSVLVSGGRGIDGQPLDSTEMWDPQARRWLLTTPLPRALARHSAVLLANGDVLVGGGVDEADTGSQDLLWHWDAKARAWSVAGKAHYTAEDDAWHGMALFALPDGGARIFMRSTILVWRPGAAVDRPAWTSTPAMLRLRGSGEVLLVARGAFGDGIPTWQAQTWDPANGTWTAAGRLAYRDGLVTGAVQLGDGQVLHAGLDGQGKLHCELARPPQWQWRACAGAQLRYMPHSLQFAQLPGGRVALLSEGASADVYDPAQDTWSTAKLEWHLDGLTFGAPVVPDKPLVELIDAAGRRHDVTPAGARLYVSVSGRRAHTLQFSDRPPVEVEGRATPPSLFWDAVNQRFTYLLPPGSMPALAARLPDGCVVGTPHPHNAHALALFDTATATVLPLPDPADATAMNERALLALPDGTVVLAGVPTGGGSGFFARKASCKGWAPDNGAADADAMPGLFDTQLPKPAAPILAAPQAAPQPWWQDPRLPLIGLAIAIPALLYVLIKFLVWPRLRRNAATPDKPLMSIGMSRILRVLVYGLVATWALPKLAFLVQKRDLETPVAALTSGRQPCAFVGKWTQTGPDQVQRILELHADGSMRLMPNPARDGARPPWTGSWAVDGKSFTWRTSEQTVGEPDDVNPIVQADEKRFELVERNGGHSRFHRIGPAPAGRCGE